MLKSTFLHLKGFGKKAERSLWKNGIISWDHYLQSIASQYSLLDESKPSSILDTTYAAYDQGNIDFFAERLPPSEYYRVALEYPNEIIFLDIETTGLSIYYDIISMIGWSIGSSYGYYINGQDSSELRDALSKSKAIVTFNGTLFDLKFICKHFSNLQIPKVHIDLRYFSKRIGLSGGQKHIEQLIGFKRDSEIEDMLGEAAPILWHKYRRGDNEALRRLIMYNNADIEGMKYILDHCICAQFKLDKIPTRIQRKFKLKTLNSTIPWSKANRKSRNSTFIDIHIPVYSGSTKPLLTYSDLNRIMPLDNYCVVGIDLVSSDARESGVCVLLGNKATTYRVKDDDSLINIALQANANLISIDSPLSIPKGRTTFTDDDPFREEFGITRHCERILKRRGINSYPCLINSMQKLTQRGMLLAEKFRSLGIPVIESYPGAAQDIMSIPRKQAGLSYLVDGLVEFGITGDFKQIKVSHDELDAITSAIVGHFFWAGMFEPLGNLDEGYLIIPDLNADFTSWINKQIIGVSGMESKKGLLARDTLTNKLLKSFNFKFITLPEDALKKNTHKNTLASLSGIDNALIFGIRHKYQYAYLLEAIGPSFKLLHFSNSNIDIELDNFFRAKAELQFSEDDSLYKLSKFTNYSRNK